MNWPLNTPGFDVEDLEHMFSYRNQPRQGKAVGQFWGHASIEERLLNSDSDLCRWLKQSEIQNKRPGLSLILASRNPLEATKHNPAHLQKVPFTSEGFQQIVASLPLHGDTARIINRSDMPFFEEIDLFSNKGDNIYYCCRTSGRWVKDLAVSCTFNPQTGFISGVVFGCSDDVAEEIAGRIENSEDSWMHPMLAIGILAEIERKRHMKLVEDHLYKLLQRVKNANKSPEILPTSQLVRENYSVDLWIEVSQLKIALDMWRAQLSKMDAHIVDFEKRFLEMPSRAKDEAPPSPCSLGSFESAKTLTSAEDSGLDTVEGVVDPETSKLCQEQGREEGEGLNAAEFPDSWHTDAAQNPGRTQSKLSSLEEFSDSKILESWRTTAKSEGRRIQKRLWEIMDEYDCKLRECSMVLDGVSLSAQLSWNQIGFQDTRTNMKIASATRRDGNQMRLIALLTMIFLPATFLASLFSMTFFNWDAGEGEHIVSPYVWIYPVVVITITSLVVGIWYYLTKRRRFFDSSWGPDDKV